MIYSYQKSGPATWTVGYFTSEGIWHSVSDWNTSEEAAERAHWLNGGIDPAADDDEASLTTTGRG